MTRHQFGQSPSDWTFTVGAGSVATLAGSVAITMWDQPSAGTQITDLLNSSGAPIAGVTSASGTGGLPIGTIPLFFGPDAVTEMWADAGGGYRSQITAHDAYAPSDDVRFGQVAGATFSGTPAAGRFLRAVNGSSVAWTADGTTGWLNVGSPGYGGGAKGDGTTDDTAAIQAALNACPPGGRVLLDAREYALASQLTVPPYVTLMGPAINRDATTDPTACLVPLAGFTGASVLRMVDQATGSYSTAHHNAIVDSVNIDGRNLTTETVAGIQATGYVHGVSLLDVGIRAMTSHSIVHVNNGSGSPYSWYMLNVQISGTGSATTWDGFHLISTDHVLIGCRTEGVRGNGFYLSGCPNTTLIGCRSEWSAANGFYITGSWGTSTGSGGLLMSGCSTDRSSQYGVLIDSTGNAPILINGLEARRDGRNGFPGTGGGGLAALRGTGATMPIIVNGMSCYPGVNDDSTGVNSPERGASFVSCTWVSVANAYLHADLTPFHDGGGNTLYRGPNVGTATGPTGTPVRSSSEAMNLAGPLTLNQGGFIASRGTGTNGAFQAQVSGDSQLRYNVNANGDIAWGSGAAAADSTWGRTAANQMSLSTADLRIATAGRGLRVAEGTNAKMGTAVLVGGTVTVATTAVTATSRIQLTSQADGGTPGWLRISARTGGTSFTITSSSATDTSTVAWLAIEPA